MKAHGRLNQTVSRTTSRLAKHPVALGLAVTVIGGLMAYIAWISVNGPPFQDRYRLEAVVSADSPVLKAGAQVREAGKLAGTITEVEPATATTRDGRPVQAVRLSMELRPEFAPVGRDATANVRVRSIVYLTYLEINPGNRDDPIPEGGEIPLAQTGSGVDLLEVVQLFDQRTRKLLRRSLVNTGQGLAGRGSELNASLGDLDRTLELGSSQLQALTRDPEAVGGGLEGAARVTRGLRGERPDDVSALIGSGDASLGAIAAQSDPLGRSLQLLRPFEDELLQSAPLLDPVLDDVTALAKTVRPVTGKLAAGVPQLDRLLSGGDLVRAESRRLADLLGPFLALQGPIFHNLYTPVASIDPILASLDRIVATVDPYQEDISRAAQGVVSATTLPYPEGQTAPNNGALRFIPVLSCHRARDPYPEPGEAPHNSAEC